jgi:hypothetical protein
MWMTPAKRRLLRRSAGNGPYGYPPGAAEFTNVIVNATTPGPTKLIATTTQPGLFAVSQPVIFGAKAGTGTPAARAAVASLQGNVNVIAGNNITFSTAPTDLTGKGTDFTGLVLVVFPY